MEQVTYPDWLNKLVHWQHPYGSDEALVDLCHRLAYQNVLNGDGPFAAIIADHSKQIIAIGINRVISENDSTAHAEIKAIRNAEQALKIHHLENLNLSLYANCAPCIMCFGAIWWSGIKQVFSSLSSEDANNLGFNEGPITQDLWDQIFQQKGVKHHPNIAKSESAFRAFSKFKEIGKLY